MDAQGRVFCAIVEEGEAKIERTSKHEEESSETLKERIQGLRESIVGRHHRFQSPYGKKPIVYVDWTASGRSVMQIEEFVRGKVLPMYGNTHTSTSITGLQTTCFRHEARQIIAQAVNAHRKDDVVIMTGSGSTAAVNRVVHLLGLDLPLRVGAPRPVVFVGPHEHHSNLLPWRESCAKVVTIAENSKGRLDIVQLERELAKYRKSEQTRLLIGSFSACSNVTGVLANVLAVTATLHRHGALSFWDYATAAPYVNVDMNPVVTGEDAPYVYKDAVFVSPHKFVGGPGASGVLVAKKRMFANAVPKQPGGGTVFYVTETSHRYVSNRVEREEGGTPDIVGSIRAGLVFQLKSRIGSSEALHRMESIISRRVLDMLKKIPNVHVLAANVDGPRLPVFSFVVRHAKSGRMLHHNFVSALLNDLYGIQARGGCACAGPYAQRLLGMSEESAQKIEDELLEKHELLRPGFSRVSFPYFLSSDEIDYVLSAISQVAREGWLLLPQYRFNHKTGEWTHRTRFTKFPTRLWLSDAPLSFDASFTTVGSTSTSASASSPDFAALLCEATSVYESAGSNVPPISDQTGVLGTESAKSLRWFVYPSEVVADVVASKRGKRKRSNPGNDGKNAERTASSIPVRPQAYRRAGDSDVSGAVLSLSATLSTSERDASLRRKYPRRTTDETPELFSGKATVALKRFEKTGPKSTSVDVAAESTATGKGRKKRRRTDEAATTGPVVVAAATTPCEEGDAAKESMTKRAWRPPRIPKKILRGVGQAIIQWNMIREGDRLLLGLSGGKDSLTLLNVLLELQRRSPVRFELAAATVDPQTDAFKPKPLRKYVESLGVPYHFLEEPIFDRAKSGQLQGNSICSFCARMKRGMLYSCCRKNGYNVLVLGQHLDDLVESFLMSAFNNGSLRTMKANYTIDEGDLRVIRPLVYVRELEMRKYSLAARLPVINENCPACFEAPKERHRVKKLLQQEESLSHNLFGNLRRTILPLMEDGMVDHLSGVAKKRSQRGKKGRKKDSGGGARRDRGGETITTATVVREKRASNGEEEGKGRG